MVRTGFTMIGGSFFSRVHLRQWPVADVTSAFGGKADIDWRCSHVRF
jgi:hypothetical protein